MGRLLLTHIRMCNNALHLLGGSFSNFDHLFFTLLTYKIAVSSCLHVYKCNSCINLSLVFVLFSTNYTPSSLSQTLLCYAIFACLYNDQFCEHLSLYVLT